MCQNPLTLAALFPSGAYTCSVQRPANSQKSFREIANPKNGGRMRQSSIGAE
jgi:hypothetical protein